MVQLRGIGRRCWTERETACRANSKSQVGEERHHIGSRSIACFGHGERVAFEGAKGCTTYAGKERSVPPMSKSECLVRENYFSFDRPDMQFTTRPKHRSMEFVRRSGRYLLSHLRPVRPFPWATKWRNYICRRSQKLNRATAWNRSQHGQTMTTHPGGVSWWCRVLRSDAFS